MSTKTGQNPRPRYDISCKINGVFARFCLLHDLIALREISLNIDYPHDNFALGTVPCFDGGVETWLTGCSYEEARPFFNAGWGFYDPRVLRVYEYENVNLTQAQMYRQDSGELLMVTANVIITLKNDTGDNFDFLCNNYSCNTLHQLTNTTYLVQMARLDRRAVLQEIMRMQGNSRIVSAEPVTIRASGLKCTQN